MTLFEKIIAREIPANIEYEDDLSIVIHDINPQAPIHLLIIPKKPIPKVSDSSVEDKDLLGHLLLVAKRVAEEKDIADIKNIEEASKKFKLDFKALNDLANSEKVSKIYKENTEEAISKNVFGAPTYVFNDELFWGQDRLEFLEISLKKSSR